MPEEKNLPSFAKIDLGSPAFSFHCALSRHEVCST